MTIDWDGVNGGVEGLRKCSLSASSEALDGGECAGSWGWCRCNSEGSWVLKILDRCFWSRILFVFGMIVVCGRLSPVWWRESGCRVLIFVLSRVFYCLGCLGGQ